jgi:glycosyltransferase involved in cell wall biosynthesis
MRLSFITVNLNNRDGLKRTLKSLFERTSRDFKSILIDGLSDDGSRDVITAWRSNTGKSSPYPKSKASMMVSCKAIR